MRPLIVGIRDGSASDAALRGASRAAAPRTDLLMVDDATGARLGTVRLALAGAVALADGTLTLHRAVGCRNGTAPWRIRSWRYALAAIHARRARARGDALRMSAADLRCLDVLYMVPRRAWLIGVAGATEPFTASLVARLGEGEMLLSLPAASREVAVIASSRVVAIGAAPADRVRDVLSLGAYERSSSAGAASALPLIASRVHGLSMPAHGWKYDLTVVATHEVGSHVLFDCRVDGESGTPEPQVAYLSEMYVEWLERRGGRVNAVG